MESEFKLDSEGDIIIEKGLDKKWIDSLDKFYQNPPFYDEIINL